MSLQSKFVWSKIKLSKRLNKSLAEENTIKMHLNIDDCRVSQSPVIIKLLSTLYWWEKKVVGSLSSVKILPTDVCRYMYLPAHVQTGNFWPVAFPIANDVFHRYLLLAIGNWIRNLKNKKNVPTTLFVGKSVGTFIYSSHNL